MTDALTKKENDPPKDPKTRPRAASTPKIPKRKLGNAPHTPKKEKIKEEPTDTSVNVTSETTESTPHKKNICTPKIQSSFVLCCGFLCFGSSMAIIGPTVLELGCLTGQDVGSMSWVFFAQTCSALFGAICSGIITDRFHINYNVFLAVVMTLHAVALSILPLMRVLGTLLLFTSFHGLFGGFQDTATNLRMIIMHGQDVPPFLQTLFFFYGVGAFLSPIIAGNFLSEECNQGETSGLDEFAFSRRRRHNGIGLNHWIKLMREKELMLTSNITAVNKNNPPPTEIVKITTTRVHYAYFIIALIHIIVTLGLWYLYFAERRRKKEDSNITLDDTDCTMTSTGPLDDSMTKTERSEIDPQIRTQVLCISFWIATMVFISDGLQGSFGSYIYTYAVKSNIGITPDDAAYLNSLFWGSLALGRLLAIFVSMYVSPRIMLLVDIAGCLASIIAMFLFRFQRLSLWIGTATFGLCLSNIFPTSVSMAESYFRLTGTITCFFVVCSGLGEMAIPLLVGKLFDIIGPITFIAVSCVLCFTAVGIYIAVIVTGRGIARRQNELSTSREIINDDNDNENINSMKFNTDNKPSPKKTPKQNIAQNLNNDDTFLSGITTETGTDEFTSVISTPVDNSNTKKTPDSTSKEQDKKTR